MIIDSIKNGIVIDHIRAGKAMELYTVLSLDDLDCSVAILKNVQSRKMGKKDIIKIDEVIDLNLDVLGYVDPSCTVSIIQNEVVVEKKSLTLPQRIENVIRCQNPRCITSAEQELPHVFKLTNRAQGGYRCVYCEAAAPKKKK